MAVDINRTTGGLTLPTSVASEIVTRAQEASLVMSRGRRVDLVGGNAAVAVSDGVKGAKFVGETERKPVGTANISEKQLRAFKLALVLSFSTEFMRDRKALYGAIIRDMPYELGRTLDAAFLFGDGKPVSSDFDSLEAAPTAELGPDPFAAFTKAIQTSAAAGGRITEFDISPAGESHLFAVAKDGRPLFTPSTQEGAVTSVLGRPVTVHRNAGKEGSPNTVGFAMDWDSVFWGMVEGVTYRQYDGPIYNGSQLLHAGAQDNMGSVICEIEVGVRTIDANRHVRFTETLA